jgi:AcrR family transcriptional regulator
VARGEETRKRILEAAQESVLAKGFDATSIDEIVAVTGITKSGFFYHFRDKNALASALIEKHIVFEDELFDDLFDRARELSDDPLQVILIGLKFLAELLEDMPNGHPGCIVATAAYQDRLFDKNVREINRRAVLGWRKRFRKMFDDIAAVYPVRDEVDLEHLADMVSGVVDAEWAARDWTLAAALRTARFWWIVLGFFCVLFAWYAVQIHQTKYLLEIGFDAQTAAWALGFVSAAAISGQIGLGALSDRIGREWVWTIACAGFAVCYSALIALHAVPSTTLLYLMVVSQGGLGYALTSVMGPIVAEIFEGPNYGAIFGTLTVALIGGGATGPWVTGLVYDAYGSYTPAFALAIALCAVSALAIWIAAPRKVRSVPGKS